MKQKKMKAIKEAEYWAMAAWGVALACLIVGIVRQSAGCWFMLAFLARIASGDCD